MEITCPVCNSNDLFAQDEEKKWSRLFCSACSSTWMPEPPSGWRRCPRCLVAYPNQAFPGVVRLCIECYARCPGNQGLDLADLYKKAKKSRTALARNNKQSRLGSMSMLRAGQNMLRMQKLPTSDFWKMDDEEVTCPICGLGMLPNEAKTCLWVDGKSYKACPNCIDAASKLEQAPNKPVTAQDILAAARPLTQAPNPELAMIPYQVNELGTPLLAEGYDDICMDCKMQYKGNECPHCINKKGSTTSYQ